jgi:hypothetical protein
MGLVWMYWYWCEVLLYMGFCVFFLWFMWVSMGLICDLPFILKNGLCDDVWGYTPHIPLCSDYGNWIYLPHGVQFLDFLLNVLAFLWCRCDLNFVLTRFYTPTMIHFNFLYALLSLGNSYLYLILSQPLYNIAVYCQCLRVFVLVLTGFC